MSSIGYAGELSGHHHASHRHLLTVEHSDYAPHARVDAIIVPAARAVESLHTAIDLAGELGCVLVVLCSKNVSADQVLASARRSDVSIVALNVDRVDILPTFQTSKLVADFRFPRRADQSRKRNLGLLLSRIAGWQRVMFLDDDIDDVHPSDVRAAAGLLKDYDVVGFHNVGFADNSVVCRAGRYLGQAQDQFIGAGALVVAPSRMGTFFPDIYNEDWFFFLGTSRMAVTGSVRHRSFSGALAPSRARQEEFGDCLGEGLFWALDIGKSLEHVDLAHWNDFLGHRLRFIDGLDALNHDGPGMAEVTAALEAAYMESKAIADQPDRCDGYMHRWRSDLRVWRGFIEDTPRGLGLTKAVTELGWYGIAELHLLPWHEEDRLIFTNGWKRAAADQQAGRPLDRSRQSPSLAQAATGHGVDGSTSTWSSRRPDRAGVTPSILDAYRDGVVADT